MEDSQLIEQILASPPRGADERALNEWQRRKRLAFAQLVERYQKLVLSVVYAMVKNEETARDLTQETFLKTYRALNQFERGRSFKAWILKIANNTVVDYLRASKNKEELSLELIMEESPGSEPHAEGDPADIAERTLFLEKLALALTLLPVRYRQAFVLRYQFDLAYDEIADVMHESENTIRTLLFRAKDRLRKILLENKTGKTVL
jgi:RNA polymerase sigma-70 factor (ECF subfamily)